LNERFPRENDKMLRDTEENARNPQQRAANQTQKGLHTFREGEGFLLRFESFNRMKRGIEEVFAGSAPILIAAAMGKPCGQLECRRILRNAKSKDEALKHLSELKKKENWGEISIIEINYSETFGKIRVENAFETRDRRSDSPVCHFLRGFLAGFLSQLFEKPIAVIETRCSGKGDEYCEFMFNKR